MELYPCKYGKREAVAEPENYNGRYRFFWVHLREDPGFGPTSFPHIHRSQITFTGVEPPAEEFLD